MGRTLPALLLHVPGILATSIISAQWTNRTVKPILNFRLARQSDAPHSLIVGSHPLAAAVLFRYCIHFGREAITAGSPPGLSPSTRGRFGGSVCDKLRLERSAPLRAITAARSGCTNDDVFRVVASADVLFPFVVVNDEAAPLLVGILELADLRGIFNFMPSDRSFGLANTSRLAS
jgi:hypothetical protein